MRITRFSAVGLHGFLDYDFQLDGVLTFLTGINGSGKTSVVRSMVALLTPHVPFLSSLQFSRLTIELDHDGASHIVSAVSDEASLSIEVSTVAETLLLPRLSAEALESVRRHRELETEFYRDVEVRFSQHPVFGFLRALPTPMYLDLERRSPDNSRRRQFHSTIEAAPARNVFAATLEESLADARDLAQEAYRNNEARLKELAQALRDDLILSAFRIDDGSSFGVIELPPKNYHTALNHNEELVSRSLQELGFGADSIASSVRPFFGRLRSIAETLRGAGVDIPQLLENRKTAGALTDWMALRPKENQIRRFVELLEKHASAVAAVSRPIAGYLAIVNRFLGDSGKGLEFAKPGNLRVRLPHDKQRGLTALSSGERQIVVILTHLAFNPQAHRANVLIIDEPELSLHVKWQEMFVDSLLEVATGIQLILATHSPSIIMDRLSNCVDLGGKPQ